MIKTWVNIFTCLDKYILISYFNNTLLEKRGLYESIFKLNFRKDFSGF